MITLLFQQNFSPHIDIMSEVDLVWAAIWACAAVNALIIGYLFYRAGVNSGKDKKGD